MPQGAIISLLSILNIKQKKKCEFLADPRLTDPRRNEIDWLETVYLPSIDFVLRASSNAIDSFGLFSLLIGILEARSMRCSSQAPLLTARLFVSIRLEWSSFRGIILILCLARSSWFNLKGLRAASLFVRTSRREEWISQWESWEAEPGQGVKRIESSRGLEDCPHHFSSHRRRSCELIRRRLANLYPLALLPRCLLPRMRLEREGPASLPE